MAAPKGNKNAAKGKDWERALRMALHTYEDSETGRGEVLLKIAKHVVKQAASGDWRAIEEVGNRIDGKPAQSVELSGGLEHRTRRELTEEELEHIATGGSAGAADEAQGSTVATPIH